MKKQIWIFTILLSVLTLVYSCNKDEGDDLPNYDDKIPSNYCTPPTYLSGPYLGITDVIIEDINNTTAYNDGYTFYEAVNVAQLKKGEKIGIVIVTWNEIMAQHNSRVWIDWNRDGDFDDANELAATWDMHGAGTIANEISVPADASRGNTRMRVYTDMTTDMGHIVPEPCGYLNHPNHLLGQHGEIEDYIVYIND